MLWSKRAKNKSTVQPFIVSDAHQSRIPLVERCAELFACWKCTHHSFASASKIQARANHISDSESDDNPDLNIDANVEPGVANPVDQQSDSHVSKNENHKSVIADKSVDSVDGMAVSDKNSS